MQVGGDKNAEVLGILPLFLPLQKNYNEIFDIPLSGGFGRFPVSNQ